MNSVDKISFLPLENTQAGGNDIPLEGLPVEMLYLIFAQMSAQTLYSAKLVSRKFFYIASDNRLPGNNPCRKEIELFKAICPYFDMGPDEEILTMRPQFSRHPMIKGMELYFDDQCNFIGFSKCGTRVYTRALGEEFCPFPDSYGTMAPNFQRGSLPFIDFFSLQLTFREDNVSLFLIHKQKWNKDVKKVMYRAAYTIKRLVSGGNRAVASKEIPLGIDKFQNLRKKWEIILSEGLLETAWKEGLKSEFTVKKLFILHGCYIVNAEDKNQKNDGLIRVRPRRNSPALRSSKN